MNIGNKEVEQVIITGSGKAAEHDVTYQGHPVLAIISNNGEIVERKGCHVVIEHTAPGFD
jgi:adenosylmethionine-8-amino-7-oxononanoate aminotransferase